MQHKANTEMRGIVKYIQSETWSQINEVMHKTFIHTFPWGTDRQMKWKFLHTYQGELSF